MMKQKNTHTQKKNKTDFDQYSVFAVKMALK